MLFAPVVLPLARTSDSSLFAPTWASTYCLIESDVASVVVEASDISVVVLIPVTVAPVANVRSVLAVRLVNTPVLGVVAPIVALSTDPPLISGDVKVLFVNVSVPASVASVPVVGKVTFVVPVVVKVSALAPAVENAAAVDTAPASVTV